MPLLENHRILIGYTEILLILPLFTVCLASIALLESPRNKWYGWIILLALSSLSSFLARNTSKFYLLAVALALVLAALYTRRNCAFFLCAGIVAFLAIFSAIVYLDELLPNQIAILGYQRRAVEVELDLGQAVLNLNYAFFVNQSFSVLPAALILTLTLSATSGFRWALINRRLFVFLLVLAGTVLGSVLVAELLLPYFRSHATPSTDTLLSRILLPFFSCGLPLMMAFIFRTPLSTFELRELRPPPPPNGGQSEIEACYSPELHRSE